MNKSCKPLAMRVRQRIAEVKNIARDDKEVLEAVEDILKDIESNPKEVAQIGRQISKLQDLMVGEPLKRLQNAEAVKGQSQSFFTGATFNHKKPVESIKTLYRFMRDKADLIISKKHFESQDLFAILDNEKIKLPSGEEKALGEIISELDQKGEFEGILRKDVLHAIFERGRKSLDYDKLPQPVKDIAEKMYDIWKDFSSDSINTSPLGKAIDFYGFSREIDIEGVRKTVDGHDYFDFSDISKTLDFKRTFKGRNWFDNVHLDTTTIKSRLVQKVRQFSPTKRASIAQELQEAYRGKEINRMELTNLTSELNLYNKIYEANLQNRSLDVKLVPLTGKEANFIELSGRKNPLTSTKFRYYKSREASALHTLYGGHTDESIETFFKTFLNEIDERLNYLSKKGTIDLKGDKLLNTKKLAAGQLEKTKKMILSLTKTTRTINESLENYSQAASRGLSAAFLGKLPVRVLAESFLNSFGMARYAPSMGRFFKGLVDFKNTIDIKDPRNLKALAKYPVIIEMRAHGAGTVVDRFGDNFGFREGGVQGSAASQKALQMADKLAWFTNKYTGAASMTNARRANGIIEGLYILDDYLKDVTWDKLPVFFRSNAERAGLDAASWKILQSLEGRSQKFYRPNGETISFRSFEDVKNMSGKKLEDVLGKEFLQEASQGKELYVYKKQIFDAYSALVHRIGTDGSFMASVLTRQDLFLGTQRGTVSRTALTAGFKFLGPAAQQARKLASWIFTKDGLYRSVWGKGGLFDPSSGRDMVAMLQGMSALTLTATTYWFISNIIRGKVPEQLPSAEEMTMQYLNMGLAGAWGGVISNMLHTGDPARAAGNFPLTSFLANLSQAGKAGLEFAVEGEISEDRQHQLMRTAKRVLFPAEFWYSTAMWDYVISKQIFDLEQTNRQKKRDEEQGVERVF